MKKIIAITLVLMLALAPAYSILASDTSTDDQTVTEESTDTDTTTDESATEEGTTSVTDEETTTDEDTTTEELTEMVAIGGDLTKAQIKTVYSYFGITQGDVEEITVTHADEAQYLQNVAADKIGSKSISSVYVETTDEGSGIDIKLYNINWLTSDIYESALKTVGITDANIVIAAPYEVSGTAALTGIYKAYEDMTNTTLDETAKEAATQELVTTGNISDSTGSSDAVSFINDIKLALKNGDLDASAADSEILSKVKSIAEDDGITLTSDQQAQVVKLVKALKGVDLSSIESSGLWDMIVSFFQNLF